MNALFIADAHLKGRKDPYQHKLVRLLERRGEEIDTLFILGDLFEFWASDHPLLHAEYGEILNTIEKLKRSGKRIVYLEGNHDFSLGEYFQRSINAEVYPDEYIESINGLNFYFAHGDNVNKLDVPYILLRKLLRSPLFTVILKIIPFEYVWKVAIFFAGIGQKKWGTPDRKIQALLRKFAEKKFHHNIDCVVLAHLHFPELLTYNLNGRKCIYVNVGGWKPDMYYLVYYNNRFEHRQFKDED